jgi:alanyl-tRNA synthetase
MDQQQGSQQSPQPLAFDFEAIRKATEEGIRAAEAEHNQRSENDATQLASAARDVASAMRNALALDKGPTQ